MSSCLYCHIISQFLYAAPAWFGFCTAEDKVRLNSFLCRCWKLGYSDRSVTFEDMTLCAETEDEQLFSLTEVMLLLQLTRRC